MSESVEKHIKFYCIQFILIWLWLNFINVRTRQIITLKFVWYSYDYYQNFKIWYRIQLNGTSNFCHEYSFVLMNNSDQFYCIIFDIHHDKTHDPFKENEWKEYIYVDANYENYGTWWRKIRILCFDSAVIENYHIVYRCVT